MTGSPASHAATAGRDEIAVDAHVHLQAFDVNVIETAADNLLRHAGPTISSGMLMLSETAGQDVFAAIRDAAQRTGSSFSVTDEPMSIWYHGHRLPVLIVAGRQIVTAERLEVLALATNERLADGLPLAQVTAWADKVGALAVLPWGVGKWLGGRGRMIRQVIKAASASTIFLGDNGGRPWLWQVGQFDEAKKRGMKVLPGTDPLPIPGEQRRIGSFGFKVTAALDRQRPMATLVQALRDPQVSITPFGRLSSPLACLSMQIRLRRNPGNERRAA